MWFGLFIKARNRMRIAIAGAQVVKVVVQDVGNTTTISMTTNYFLIPTLYVGIQVLCGLIFYVHSHFKSGNEKYSQTLFLLL